MQSLFFILAVFLLVPPAAPPPPTFSITADAALVKLQRSLPKGWTMKITDDQLVIRSQADVWVLYENRINAPDTNESEALRNARIMKYGKKMPSTIELRLEKKWDAARLDAARAKNRGIHTKTAALIVKHGLGPVFQGNSKNTPGALAERQGLGDAYRRYEKEKNVLEAGLIRLPEYESSLCSLWIVRTQGDSDEFSLIHPYTISEQNFGIRNNLRKTLSEVK